MKKTVFFFILIFLLVSCSRKKKIEGERLTVFSYKDILQESDKKVKITLPIKSEQANYYGSSSLLNVKIENYKFNKNWEDKKIKFKEYHVGFQSTSNRYRVFSPVIINDIAYIMSPNGFLYAKDLNNSGKNLWKNKIIQNTSIKDFSFAKISYFDEKIIISTGYNEIISVYAKNGKIDWIKKLNAVPVSHPVITDEVIYIITNDNKLYALDRNDGDIKWIHSGISKRSAVLGSANPVVYKNIVFASYSSGEIYAINQKNGETIWSKTLTADIYNFTSFELTDIDATPLIKREKIYAVSNSGKLAAINVVNGNTIWEKDFSSITDFWIAGEFLYIMNNDNILTCIEMNIGAIQWAKNLQKYKKPKKNKGLIVYKNIIMVNDKLLLINNLKQMLIISPIDGAILKTLKLKGNIFDTPVFVNGEMYFNAARRFNTKLTKLY
jgi:outer membrane protein assembly factor BamB